MDNETVESYGAVCEAALVFMDSYESFDDALMNIARKLEEAANTNGAWFSNELAPTLASVAAYSRDYVYENMKYMTAYYIQRYNKWCTTMGVNQKNYNIVEKLFSALQGDNFSAANALKSAEEAIGLCASIKDKLEEDWQMFLGAYKKFSDKYNEYESGLVREDLPKTRECLQMVESCITQMDTPLKAVNLAMDNIKARLEAALD